MPGEHDDGCDGSYKTVQGRASAEVVAKKSRFIGQIAHVDTEDEALSFLEEVRGEHRMARHNVYAYVVRGGGDAGSAPRIRYSDDGEPSKTAGMPTLEALQHAGLSNVAAVVTRYFGGVLLGTGGLVRAYTQATQSAVEAAHVVTVVRCVDVTADIPYSAYDQVIYRARKDEIKVVESDFAESVHMVLRVPAGTESPLMAQLAEITGGKGTIVVSETFDALL